VETLDYYPYGSTRISQTTGGIEANKLLRSTRTSASFRNTFCVM
jgi:hypothetical protein